MGDFVKIGVSWIAHERSSESGCSKQRICFPNWGKLNEYKILWGPLPKYGGIDKIRGGASRLSKIGWSKIFLEIQEVEYGVLEAGELIPEVG